MIYANRSFRMRNGICIDASGLLTNTPRSIPALSTILPGTRREHTTSRQLCLLTAEQAQIPALQGKSIWPELKKAGRLRDSWAQLSFPVGMMLQYAGDTVFIFWVNIRIKTCVSYVLQFVAFVLRVVNNPLLLMLLINSLNFWAQNFTLVCFPK